MNSGCSAATGLRFNAQKKAARRVAARKVVEYDISVSFGVLDDVYSCHGVLCCSKMAPF
jgi:hypothetical protein